MIMKIIVRRPEASLKVIASKNNTSIQDSYKIISRKDMKKVLIEIQERVSKNMAVNNRSLSSMIREWESHNILYACNYQPDRTGSVDLELNPKWYYSTMYWILSTIYRVFF